MSAVTATDASSKAQQARQESWIDGASVAFVLIVSVVLFSAPLRNSGNLLPYAQDDLYYYLVVARNLAQGLGSTFDGVTPTNGYHPLYLLLLWAVTKISASLVTIFRFLFVLDVAAAAATFIAARAIFARAIPNRLLANGCAFIVLWMSLYRFYHQMEVTLVLPLGFCLLLLLDRPPTEITAGRWAGIGLIAGVFILSRLDSGLLVVLCGLVVLLQREYLRTLSAGRIIAFLTGFLPLLIIYCFINERFFGVLLPISGAAKQTRISHAIYLHALQLSLSRGTEVMFALSAIALCWTVVRWRSLQPQHRLLCLAGLLFPFLHWGVNVVLSDWMMWSWYKYSLTFSIAMALLLIGISSNQWQPRRARLVGGAVISCGAFLLLTARYRPDSMMVDVADGARFISDFAATHPGKYAMGDRAGMVGYILPQPLLQTEGLMMDAAFLNCIKTREPLLNVLHAYHVSYYVGFQPSDKPSSQAACFDAREPAQAGPYSPVMTAVFCEKPVAQFDARSGRTMIFDVRTADHAVRTLSIRK